VKYLVGTKADLKDSRQITVKEAEECASKLGARYFEVSSKDVKLGSPADVMLALVDQLSEVKKRQLMAEKMKESRSSTNKCAIS
jgi:hypothetical protein